MTDKRRGGENMTLQEIAQLMIKDIDKYSTVKTVMVPKIVQTKTHKKARVNKKWKKRYGITLIYEETTAKVADITVDDIVEFCAENSIPLPQEFLNKG